MCKALDEYWDKAKDEGHRETRTNIVVKMLENNLPEETICTLATITREEVQEITVYLTTKIK